MIITYYATLLFYHYHLSSISICHGHILHVFIFMNKNIYSPCSSLSSPLFPPPLVLFLLCSMLRNHLGSFGMLGILSRSVMCKTSSWPIVLIFWSLFFFFKYNFGKDVLVWYTGYHFSWLSTWWSFLTVGEQSSGRDGAWIICMQALALHIARSFWLY